MYIADDEEVCAQTGALEGLFGVHDAFAVLATVQHDDPSRSTRLADVTEHVQTAIDAPPDVAAAVILQNYEQRRADVGGRFRKPLHLRLDWFEFRVRAYSMQLARDLPLYVVAVDIVGVGVCHNPIADGGEDGAWLEALRRALREHARD